jgi:CRP-like cAMP-binding protein
VTAAGEPGGLQRFVDLDTALEWCEERLLRTATLPPPSLPTLTEHDFCVGLGRQELRVLQPLLQLRRFSPGQLIIRDGDHPEEIFLLMQGRVSVTVDLPGGRRRRVATVSPGMVFGELTVVDRSPRTADVRADTVVECLALPATALDRLGVTHPEIRMTILENLLRNVHRTVRRLSHEVVALEG